MSDPDIRAVKTAVATLATCIVQTLEARDPGFQSDFLERLTEAYYEHRDNSDADTLHTLEALSWTRSMLTGFSHITGPGEPFLGGVKG